MGRRKKKNLNLLNAKTNKTCRIKALKKCNKRRNCQHTKENTQCKSK
jgi:hypothetical protein